MSSRKKYTAYRRVLEKLGLKQLDVYRYKDHDEVRVLTPDGRVLMVKLSRKRDEMSPEEFEQEVRRALASQR